MFRSFAQRLRLQITITAAMSLCVLGGLVSAGAQTSPIPSPAPAPRTIDPSKDVGIDQKLDQPIPMDAAFHDEDGNAVHLGDYFKAGKPVILNMIFYKCQGSCNVQLDSMQALFRAMKLNLGEDYKVVTISINPAETPDDAAVKKKELAAVFKDKTTLNGWHLLTGDQDQIKKVAQAVGFRYVYVSENNYAHMVSLILVTPQGKISRYFTGVSYSPKDTRLALVEASANRIGTIADVVYLLCSDYDPATGKYGVSIMKAIRLGSIGTILIMGIGIFTMVRLEKRRNAKTPTMPPGAPAH